MIGGGGIQGALEKATVIYIVEPYFLYIAYKRKN